MAAELFGSQEEAIGKVIKLTGPERDLVTSWAAPEAWFPGTAHPGRGRYLVKTGERPGLPVAMTLVGDEVGLYNTDSAVRSIR